MYNKIKNSFKIVISAFLVISALFCVAKRTAVIFDGKDNMMVAAAALTMSKGSYNFSEKETTAPVSKNEEPPKIIEKNNSNIIFENYYNSLGEHKNEKKFPIYTKQFSSSGTKYKNFYVKNSTDYNLNIDKTINSPLGFKMENTKEVQVLLYHTHTSESYMDRDVSYYYESFYPRTQDSRYNVVRVGEEIKKELEKAGIGVVHDTTIHDESYSGSYSRSRKTVEKNLKKYPDIKVTIDIHRDSIGTDKYKVKPTFTYNGKKAAQIMIMSGYDLNGDFNFPKWNYNLRFALQLQKMCETNFEGFTRPLSFGNFVYNMNINTGSILVEVGADSNTLEEAIYSGKLFGKALSEVLQKNM